MMIFLGAVIMSGVGLHGAEKALALRSLTSSLKGGKGGGHPVHRVTAIFSGKKVDRLIASLSIKKEGKINKGGKIFSMSSVKK